MSMSLALPIASTFLENNANVKFEPLLIVTLMPLICLNRWFKQT